jgi:hypothetical protein
LVLPRRFVVIAADSTAIAGISKQFLIPLAQTCPTLRTRNGPAWDGPDRREGEG